VSLPVIIAPEAKAQIHAIEVWWAANRPAAPDLHRHLRGLRRALLRATRYHVYYELRGDSVSVLAVWHSHRGHAPKL